MRDKSKYSRKEKTLKEKYKNYKAYVIISRRLRNNLKKQKGIAISLLPY